MSEKNTQQEQLRSMPCEGAKDSIKELTEKGWEEAWSFHYNNPEQWNGACDIVKNIMDKGFEALLVQSEDGAERNDCVAYIYKKEK